MLYGEIYRFEVSSGLEIKDWVRFRFSWRKFMKICGYIIHLVIYRLLCCNVICYEPLGVNRLI